MHILVALIGFNACGGASTKATSKTLRDAIRNGAQILPNRISLQPRNTNATAITYKVATTHEATTNVATNDYDKQEVITWDKTGNEYFNLVNNILKTIIKTNFQQHIGEGKYIAYVIGRDERIRKYVVEAKYVNDNVDIKLYGYGSPDSDKLVGTVQVLIKSPISKNKPYGEFEVSWYTRDVLTLYDDLQEHSSAMNVSASGGVTKAVSNIANGFEKSLLKISSTNMEFYKKRKEEDITQYTIAHSNDNYLVTYENTTTTQETKYYDKSTKIEQGWEYGLFNKNDKSLVKASIDKFDPYTHTQENSRDNSQSNVGYEYKNIYYYYDKYNDDAFLGGLWEGGDLLQLKDGVELNATDDSGNKKTYLIKATSLSVSLEEISGSAIQKDKPTLPQMVDDRKFTITYDRNKLKFPPITPQEMQKIEIKVGKGLKSLLGP